MRLAITVPTPEDAARLEAYARRNGWTVTRHPPGGRPRVTDRPGLLAAVEKLRPDIVGGRITYQAAAERLGCSAATLWHIIHDGEHEA